MGRMIGIDLGTTNSCVAIMDNGGPRVIHNRQGDRTTPSVVAFTSSGQVLVGAPALRQAAANPEGTIYAAKRLLGRKFDASELQTWKRLVPYSLIAAQNGDAWVRVGERKYSAEEISAFILEELRRSAEDYLGEKISAATVTVPAYFNDMQRQATRDAGAIAGLKIENILNEPTAAALGYGLASEEAQTIAVFDLGGGTFDVTILRKAGDVFEVLSTHGDTFLGGDDFDARLVTTMCEDVERKHGVDLTRDASAMYRLKEAVECAKRELSVVESTPIHLPFLSQTPQGPLNIDYPAFSRRLLESLTGTLIERLEQPCRIALEGAGLGPNKIDQVLLVGGMTRMPAVRRKVLEIFGAPIRKDVNPDEAVAIGAAAQCGILVGELNEVALMDVTPYQLGVRVKGDRISALIPKNCSIPTSVTRTFATTVDLQTAVMIEVFQGENQHADHNTYLGRFELGNLPLRPAGNVQVDVVFELDADGLLQVTARETSTMREASVTINPSGGLGRGEVQRLVRAHQGASGTSLQPRVSIRSAQEPAPRPQASAGSTMPAGARKR